MNKFAHTIISALVGGIVGAMVVFLLPVKSPDKAKFDQLEVRDLIITEQAALYAADKKSESEKKSDDSTKDEKKEKRPDVLIKNGGIYATNVILSTRLISKQIQGAVLIGNRMFTSPDDVVNNQSSYWKFYTEIGSSIEKGGEIIVRSSTGGLLVGKDQTPAPAAGWALRAGYMDGDRPDISFYSNLTKEIMPVAILRRTVTPETPAEKTASNAAIKTPPPNPITTSGGNVTMPTMPNNPLSPVNPLDNSNVKPDFTGASVTPITTPITTPTTSSNANPAMVNSPIVPTNPSVADANKAENNKPR
jgi:gas vesicle protein